MTDKKEPTIHEIEAQRWQEELIEILQRTRPAYFYKVDEDVLSEVEGLDEGFEYDSHAGGGNPAFIVADQELSKDQLQKIGKEIVARVTQQGDQAAGA